MASVSSLSSPTVAFIGGGNMAYAIISGLVHTHTVAPAQIRVASPSGGSAALKALGVQCMTDNAAAVEGADVVVLAVKPMNVRIALEPCVRAHTHAQARDPAAAPVRETILVSIVAGMSIAQIQEACGSWRPKVIRVMPNTPVAVGQGASAMCSSESVTPEEADMIRKWFRTVGTIHDVKESQMDGVTGLSGSGPAYVFLFIEALADGGVAAGLPRATALELATQMVKGAAHLLQDTKKHPGELKDSVASPGGTTIAGIRALEDKAFRGAVMGAVVAAATRSAELRK